MEKDSRKPIGSYLRNFQHELSQLHPRKVIGSQWGEPRIYWEGLQEGQPVIIRPRKVIYSYFRKPRIAWDRQPVVIKPRKPLGSHGGEPSHNHPRKPIRSSWSRPKAA